MLWFQWALFISAIAGAVAVAQEERKLRRNRRNKKAGEQSANPS